MNTTQRDRLIKKVEIAIDKMVDIQDMGLGNAEVARILEMLNALARRWHNSK